MVLTGWMGLACFVSGLAVGVGAVSWWDENRRLEHAADRDNQLRHAGYRAGLADGRRQVVRQATGARTQGRPLPPPRGPRR